MVWSDSSPLLLALSRPAITHPSLIQPNSSHASQIYIDGVSNPGILNKCNQAFINRFQEGLNGNNDSPYRQVKLNRERGKPIEYTSCVASSVSQDIHLLATSKLGVNVRGFVASGISANGCVYERISCSIPFIFRLAYLDYLTSLASPDVAKIENAGLRCYIGTSLRNWHFGSRNSEFRFGFQVWVWIQKVFTLCAHKVFLSFSILTPLYDIWR